MTLKKYSHLVCALVGALFLNQFAFSQSLQPEKTWAVIVGVLEWESTSLASFPKENRRDQGLYDQLKAMGVPEANMTLLLDEKATNANIINALKKASSDAAEETTFIFYYAGHGYPGSQGIYFASVDAGNGPEGFLVSNINDILGKTFKGKNVLLFADCCYSGGLSDVALELSKSGFKAGSLTSASIANTSTSNWTFTCSLIDALNGRGLLDRNNDGIVSISEAGSDVKDLMNQFEQQHHGFALNGLEESFQLGKVKVPSPSAGSIPEPFDLRQCVRIKVNDKSQMARIVGGKNDQLKLEVQRYHDRKTIWSKTDAVRKSKPSTLPQVPTSSADFPEPLDPDIALKTAAVNGKYAKLQKRIKVKYDFLSYGEFSDYGYWNQNQYAGHKQLPSGYWVYVYPHWYIFGQKVESDKPSRNVR